MRPVRGHISFVSLALSHGRLRASKAAVSLRSYSTPTIIQAPGNEVKTKIKNGIGRPIDAVITYPPRPEHDSPVIFALGNGLNQLERDNHAQALAWSTNATIVSPLYTIGRQWSFPAPVHMTLAIFDWISQNLLRVESDTKRRKLGVCGGGVCGTLATMLALTECNPNLSSISAAAVNNPILDWTDIFPEGRDMVVEDLETADLDRSEKWTSGDGPDNPDDWVASIDNLVDLRKAIFRKAEDFFDPFASPLLFFRTAHFDLPYSFYGNAKFDSQRHDSSSEENMVPISRKRTYYRVHPPVRSGLVLPRLRMTVGKDYVLNHQSGELEHYMKRSFMRDKEQSQTIREEDLGTRFVTEEREGHGIWDQSYVVKMGQWLGEVLRNG